MQQPPERRMIWFVAAGLFLLAFAHVGLRAANKPGANERAERMDVVWKDADVMEIRRSWWQKWWHWQKYQVRLGAKLYRSDPRYDGFCSYPDGHRVSKEVNELIMRKLGDELNAREDSQEARRTRRQWGLE